MRLFNRERERDWVVDIQNCIETDMYLFSVVLAWVVRRKEFFGFII